MTRERPIYDEDELTARAAPVRERKSTTMRLDAKAILGAVAVIVKEERAARDKAIAELTARIERLETRIAEQEQRAPGRGLRAVGGE